MGTTSKPRKVSAKRKRKTWRSPKKQYPAIIIRIEACAHISKIRPNQLTL